MRKHWDVNESIRQFGSPSKYARKKRCRAHDERQSFIKSNARPFFYVFSPAHQIPSPIFPALFYQNNTQRENNIYDNNVRDVSEENGNIDLDYSEEENDENIIINTDDQLGEAKIAILSELYKTIKKKKQKKQRNIC